MGEVEQTLTAADDFSPPSAAASPSTSSSSKIHFRPRKIRKLSNTSIKQINEPPAVLLLPRPLTAAGEIDSALNHLRAADPILASVIDSHPPPLLETPSPLTPFQSLARSILYQQLASKAASSIYSRFLSLFPESLPLPLPLLRLSPIHLRGAGVSSRKASYLHDLATKFHSGLLSDSSLPSMDDDSLLSTLTMVKGIGAWSVHMFMIFSLHRPDVLPAGDLGVRKGVQLLYGLDEAPRPNEMEKLCQKWRPYRSVGAWYMWRLLESKRPPPLKSNAAAAAAAIDSP